MTVLDQAQNIGGVVSAARRRERWQQQMANTSDEERREQLREAIADLEARFPELEGVPPGGAEGFARGRGHGTSSRSPVRHGRQRLQPSAPSAKKSTRGGLGADSHAARSKKKGPAGLDPGARRTSSQRSSAKGAPTPKVDSAIRQTGIPAAVESGTSTTMLLLGATVSIGLLELVLSSSEKRGSGAEAVPTLIASIKHGLARFIEPRDFFGAGPQSAAPAPGQLQQQLPQLPHAPGIKKLKPIHFPPQYVIGGRGR